MDPIYGYEAVNVEAQQRDPSSLLNWMKRMVAVRQGHPAFGRGSLRLLYPQNRKVLAYLREHEGDVVLCVANLSRAAQAVELSLADFKGRVPVELLGRSAFPPIGDLPYMLTLPAYGFYWFLLPEAAELPRWHEDLPEPLPDFITLVVRDGLRSLVDGQSARNLTHDVLPAFLAKQRWFAAKDAAISKVGIAAWAEFTTGRDTHLLTEIEVEFASGEAPHRYFMPLGTSFDEQALTFGWPLLPFSLAQVRRGAKVGALYDGMAAEDFPRAAGLRRHDPVFRQLRHRERRGAARRRGPAPARRAEQLLDPDRRSHHSQGVSKAGIRRAAGARDRPLPDRPGGLRQRAAPARRDRASRA
jgi:maltose alpha-D-glucosyltransferase/alpha-amylase